MQRRINKIKFWVRQVSVRAETFYRHHRFALPVISVAVIVGIFLTLLLAFRGDAGSLTGRLETSNIVILHADNQTRTIPSREATVGELLEKAGISIQEGDIVEPAQATEINDDDFRINVYRAAPVVIEDKDKTIQTVSAALTSRSIASQVGIKVYPEDEIRTEPSQDFIRDGIGSKVVIERSVPVTLNLYGTSLPIRTQAKTIEQLLREKNVVLQTGDNVRPSIDTPISDNTQVFVTRHGTEVMSIEESIAMPMETIEDSSLSFGTSAIRQQGSDGKKSVTYELQMENGVEVGRRMIQEVVVVEPVKQIIARGKAISIPSDHQAVMRQAGIAESDFAYAEYVINHENRLWCPTRWQGQNHCPAYYEEKFPGSENHSSTGYGLCQATPGIKMASVGSDWRVNPVTQMKWCNGYASSRYGGWYGAYNAWISKGWW